MLLHVTCIENCTVNFLPYGLQTIPMIHEKFLAACRKIRAFPGLEENSPKKRILFLQVAVETTLNCGVVAYDPLFELHLF